MRTYFFTAALAAFIVAATVVAVTLTLTSAPDVTMAPCTMSANTPNTIPGVCVAADGTVVAR